MRIVRSMVLSCAVAAVVLLAVADGWALPTPEGAVQRGQAFLMGLLDTNMSLLPEYRGAKVYWLFHDNYLAAKVLAAGRPEISRRIMAAIHREGVDASGRIQAVFGEQVESLPFRQHELKDIRRVGDKLIRTEMMTQRPFYGWENYADLLFLACLTETNQPAARRDWEAAMRMWDGKGFVDEPARQGRRYATYKLGLALVAARHLSPPAEPPAAVFDKLLSLQDESGGWITDYDATGKMIGLANVETTCLCILGIEVFTGHQPSPAK